MKFTKMHGLGNDFVLLDQRRSAHMLDHEQIRRIGDRHRGVGFDQLILIDKPDAADCDIELRFYNSDGSIAGACGNGSRCAAALVMAGTGQSSLVMGSPAGPLPAQQASGGKITVWMPEPTFDWQDIPLAWQADTQDLPLDHPTLANPSAVSMGNPHAVFFVDDLDAVAVEALGTELEHHPIFVDRANIGFAQVTGRQTIRLRVFERGAGLTLACGSGSCAAMVAAHRRGMVDDRVTLHLDGGDLEIGWTGSGPVAMTGPVSWSFNGEWIPGQLDR